MMILWLVGILALFILAFMVIVACMYEEKQITERYKAETDRLERLARIKADWPSDKPVFDSIENLI